MVKAVKAHLDAGVTWNAPISTVVPTVLHVGLRWGWNGATSAQRTFRWAKVFRGLRNPLVRAGSMQMWINGGNSSVINGAPGSPSVLTNVLPDGYVVRTVCTTHV
jgi:hypothetical protein